MTEEMGRPSIRLVGRAVSSAGPDEALCHALRRLADVIARRRAGGPEEDAMSMQVAARG